MIKRNEKPLIEQKVQIQDALQLIQTKTRKGGGRLLHLLVLLSLARVEGVVWGVLMEESC